MNHDIRKGELIMKFVKKYAALTLALIMAISLAPALKVNASTYGYEGEVWWYYDGGGVLSIGYPGESCTMKDFDSVLPAWAKQSWYGNVKKLVIRPGVKNIGEGAFTGCSAKEIVFEANSSCTKIGYEAFYGTEFTEIKIPKKVKVIDGFAFESSWVKKVTFESGSKLETIGYYAFFDSGLESISLPSSLKRIQNGAFSQTELKSITIPRYCTSLGRDVFLFCRNLKSISVHGKNKSLSSKSGVLFNKKKSKLIQYPTAKTGSTYTVPSSVKEITDYAFMGSEVLAIYPKVKTIKMSKNIRKIGENAFEFTDIRKIYFPKRRPTIVGGTMFDADMAVTIYYKKKYWPSKYRKNYGAKKVIWKRY